MTCPKADALGACRNAPSNREIEKAQGSYFDNYSNAEDANLMGFSEADRKRVSALLASFGASSMGEGDPISGGNTLAAMACSLANVEHSGSGLVDLDGSLLEVGTSLLISGSHSSALIGEQVFRPLEQKQNHLSTHLENYEIWRNQNEAKAPILRKEDSTDIAEYLVEDVVGDVFNHVSLDGGLYPEQCLRLIRPASSGFQRGLLKHSLVFITAASHEQLIQNLGRSHSGYLFVRIGVNQGSGGMKLADACEALMDGRAIHGNESGTVRGHIFMTDPVCGLSDMIRGDNPSSRLCSRMLWLTDSPAGPICEASNGPVVKLGRTRASFEEAMDQAWCRRLNIMSVQRNLLKTMNFDFQNEWILFLKSRETECPGITGAARSFLGTLIFGLWQIKERDKNKEFRLDVPEVAAFARFLVLRMINARNSMLHAGDQARLSKIGFKITSKLDGQPPMSIREITRKFNSLSSDECLEALLMLNQGGCVVPVGDKWALVSTKTYPSASDHAGPMIEI